MKEVFLDGQLMKLVVRADDEAGEIVHYPKVDGKLVEEAPGRVRMDTLRGEVKIVLNEGWRYDTVHQKFVFIPENRR